MKYFDTKHKRLVFIEQPATTSFWDSQWEAKNFERAVKSGDGNNFVIRQTRRYLPIGSKILEGGCGSGKYVYGLHQAGYESYGIDTAEKTVENLNYHFPALHIRHGDVRSVQFPDNFFDGYWSLGVIEHFYDGYERILYEMHRVIRPGGYLFLAFPYLSPLRLAKARHGDYPEFHESADLLGNFYQFALDKDAVVADSANHGLILVQSLPMDGLKGAKDEMSFLSSWWHSLYAADRGPMTFVRKVVNKMFEPFAAHSILLIFRRNDPS